MAFFSGLASEGYDRQYSDRQLVTRIAGYFSPYWLRLVIVTLLVLIIAGAGAATPVIVSRDCGSTCSSKLMLPSTILFLCGDCICSRFDNLDRQLGQASSGDSHCWEYRPDLTDRCVSGGC